MACWRSATELNARFLKALRARIENQHSTRSAQLALVGVKCRCQLSDRRGPRPGATVPSHPSPPAANPRRHARTVFGDTPTRRAVSSLAAPAAADNSARAWRTTRTGSDTERDSLSNSVRSPSLTANGGAIMLKGMEPWEQRPCRGRPATQVASPR